MNKIFKYFSFAAILTVTFVLSSCHTPKVVTGTLTGANPEKARFEHVVQNGYKYEALQSKVKYSLGKTSLNGKMCLESGHRLCMQVNAPLIGFEVGRIEATQDSVIVVDKYDKMYAILGLGNLYDIKDINGHEMEALECLMLGRIFIPGKGQATNKDFGKLSWSTPQLADGQQGYSEGVYQSKDYSILYAIDENGRLVSTLLAVGAKTARWEYADYIEAEDGKWLPTQEYITVTNAENKEISVGLKLTNPSLGESTWRDFEPSDSFSKVSVKEIGTRIKSLTK
jgi:hypothetical protein